MWVASDLYANKVKKKGKDERKFYYGKKKYFREKENAETFPYGKISELSERVRNKKSNFNTKIGAK